MNFGLKDAGINPGIEMPEEEINQEDIGVEIKGEQQINSLADYINKVWDQNSQAKIISTGQSDSVEARLIRNRQDIDGEYDSYTLSQIQAGGGTKRYLRLSYAFAEQAKAYMAPVFFPSDGSDIFTAKPSPMPELPQELIDSILRETTNTAIALGIYKRDVEGQPLPPSKIEEVAKNYFNITYTETLASQIETNLKASEVMTKILKDQWNRSCINDALKDLFSDITWSPSIVLKYPVTRMEMIEKYIPGGKGIEIKETAVKKAERIDPFYFYPAQGIKNVNDGNIIEKLCMTPSDLSSLRGVAGYKTDAIERVLDEYGDIGYRRVTTADSAKAAADKTGIPDAFGSYPNIDTLEFWGSVPGKILKEWEVELETTIDPYKYYEICAWLAGPNEVIKAMLNENPFGKKPYYVTGYDRVPGSVWNKALAEMLKDIQGIVADTGRAFVNNLQKSSDSVTVIDVALLAGKTVDQTLIDIKEYGIRPGMRFLIDSAEQKVSTNIKPIEFYQPKNNVAENIMALNYLFQLASIVSGIPLPQNLLGSLQPQGTASGKQMDRADGLKRLGGPISNINDDIIKPLIRDMYAANMLDPDVPETAKGDLEIDVVGTASSIATEERVRKVLEGLTLMQNPAVLQMMGPGAVEILKQYYKLLGFDPEKIVQGGGQMAQPQGVTPMAQPTPLQPDGATPQGGEQPMQKVV